MTQESEWLIELGAHTGAEQITLRYSSSGYTTRPGDSPANAYYDGRIASIGTFSRHLFGNGLTMGPVPTAISVLVLVLAALNGPGI